ncbi:hypothetical protein F5Y04DRAFT_290566 [Hypomontagnella monticulosa]|nr:hypothetical protein F5Y04DRAFT_290566 [Hypomontagnella monticulosa]
MAPNNNSPFYRADGKGIDFEGWLSSVDWTAVDWREVLNIPNPIPWAELSSSLIRRLAAAHQAWDALHGRGSPLISPAVEELIRRQKLSSSILGPFADSGQSPYEWLTTQTNRDKRPDKETVAEEQNVSKSQKITVGYELEFPVAVYATNGDPHPNDTRKLWHNLKEETDPEKAREQVVSDILMALNMQTNIVGKIPKVFAPRDEDEDTGLYELRIKNLRKMEETGFGPAENVKERGSPSKNPVIYSKKVEEAAQDAFQYLCDFIFDAGIFPRCMMNEDYASGTPDSFEWPEILDDAESEQARRRLRDMLRLEGFIAKRDPRHVPLPGMKPRYKAFSVYANPGPGLLYTERWDYTDFNLEIGGVPSKAYHWEMIKIVSPVLEIQRGSEAKDIEEDLTDICRVMRTNFRIHQDLDTILASTQINVSFERGIDLIDLKKLYTIMGLNGEKWIWRLNRYWRNKDTKNVLCPQVCGDIRRHSNLGAISFTNPAPQGFGDHELLPHPTPEEIQRFYNIMDEYLPPSAHKEITTELTNRIFYCALWCYGDVSSFSKALGTGLPSRATELMSKVWGHGGTAGPIKYTTEELYAAEKEGRNVRFNVVDEHRGVVEFRSMAGSLDPANIMAWLKFCVEVTCFAKYSSAAEYKDYFERILRGDGLFSLMKFPPSVREYYKSHMIENEVFSPDGRSGSTVSWTDPFLAPLSGEKPLNYTMVFHPPIVPAPNGHKVTFNPPLQKGQYTYDIYFNPPLERTDMPDKLIFKLTAFLSTDSVDPSSTVPVQVSTVGDQFSAHI